MCESVFPEMLPFLRATLSLSVEVGVTVVLRQPNTDALGLLNLLILLWHQPTPPHPTLTHRYNRA